MKSLTLTSFMGLLMMTLLAAACSKGRASTDKLNTIGTPTALPVDIIVASKQPVEQVEQIAGSIVPGRSVDISSEVSRIVSQVMFKDGSLVQKGALLYKLDDRDIHARIRQLQAELNLARINESRLGNLLATEAVRREEYDAAYSRLQYLEASMELLNVELSKTLIRAPFSGRVGISKAFSGTLVSPGMSLVSIQEQSNLKMQFLLGEKYIHLAKPGNNIRFTSEVSGDTIDATIISSEASVSQTNRSLTVQAVFKDNKGLFRPGMSAKVILNTAEANIKGIRVPTEALIPGTEGYKVFVINNGRAALRAVNIDHRDDQFAVIRKGIEEGDSVMVSNLLRAADGIPVSIVSAN